MDKLSACCHWTVSSTGMPTAPGPRGAGEGGHCAVILGTRGAVTLTTVDVEVRAKGTWVVAIGGGSLQREVGIETYRCEFELAVGVSGRAQKVSRAHD